MIGCYLQRTANGCTRPQQLAAFIPTKRARSQVCQRELCSLSNATTEVYDSTVLNVALLVPKLATQNSERNLDRNTQRNGKLRESDEKWSGSLAPGKRKWKGRVRSLKICKVKETATRFRRETMIGCLTRVPRYDDIPLTLLKRVVLSRHSAHTLPVYPSSREVGQTGSRGLVCAVPRLPKKEEKKKKDTALLTTKPTLSADQIWVRSDYCLSPVIQLKISTVG